MKDCTVIIPVYNCEASPLRRCLQRVFALGDSFEILVIDDGSTDETPKVLEEMKKQMPSLQVIRQSNTGVSGARNAGIVKATGKWVVFCDADDELDPGALKTNLQTMEQCNADYGYGDFSKIVSGNRETITTEDLHTAEQVLHTMLCRPNQYGAVWGKVYRRQFLQENHLTFNPDLSHAEDTEFLVRVLQKARHVTKLPEIMYTYYIYPSSSAKINQAALHHFRNALEAIHQDVAWEPEGIQKAFYNCCCINLLIMMVNYIFRPGVSFMEGKPILDGVLREELIQDALKHYDRSEMGKANRVVLTALKNNQLQVAYAAAKVRQAR